MFSITLALVSALALPPASVGAVSPTHTLALPDTLVDVGGHRLNLEVQRGTEPLTIVFEAGGGADVSSWGTVPDSLAARTDATVVAYDRAGMGRSDLGPPDLSPRDEVAHLRLALERVGAPRRTIVVGHSYGALLALLHAALHPDDVIGLVLVDPMNPRFVEATGDFVHTTVPDISNPQTDRERGLARMIRGFDDLIAEVAPLEPELRAPMVVLTAGEAWWEVDEIDAAWRASHEAMAKEAPNRRQIVVEGSDHNIPDERPDVVVDAVVGLLR